MCLYIASPYPFSGTKSFTPLWIMRAQRSYAYSIRHSTSFFPQKRAKSVSTLQNFGLRLMKSMNGFIPISIVRIEHSCIGLVRFTDFCPFRWRLSGWIRKLTRGLWKSCTRNFPWVGSRRKDFEQRRIPCRWPTHRSRCETLGYSGTSPNSSISSCVSFSKGNSVLYPHCMVLIPRLNFGIRFDLTRYMWDTSSAICAPSVMDTRPLISKASFSCFFVGESTKSSGKECFPSEAPRLFPHPEWI